MDYHSKSNIAGKLYNEINWNAENYEVNLLLFDMDLCLGDCYGELVRTLSE